MPVMMRAQLMMQDSTCMLMTVSRMISGTCAAGACLIQLEGSVLMSAHVSATVCKHWGLHGMHAQLLGHRPSRPGVPYYVYSLGTLKDSKRGDRSKFATVIIR